MPSVELSPRKIKKCSHYSQLSSDEDTDLYIDASDKNQDDEDMQRHDNENVKVYREVILITLSLFMGYASLVCLQKKLYNQLQSNIGTPFTNQQKQWFEHGTSLVYFGNLLFRLLHNVIFCIWTPRHRVVISLLSMCIAMAILLASYWWFQSTSIVWVYISYLCGGVGIGSFESNILSTITPLGHQTKLWAMMGMSVGFVTITVGGFGFMALTGLDVVFIYMTVFCCCFASIFLFLLCIPVPTTYNHQQSFKQFIHQVVLWREWLPDIKWYCVALMFDMFCVSYNTAINQYIYDGIRFPLLGALSPHQWMITQNEFFCALNFCQFVGDISGRKMIYYFKCSVQPCYFLILSFVGLIGVMSKIPAIALLATMLVMLANGLIYSSSTYGMDLNLTRDNRQYLLTSLSVWLFIGDIGSVTGSNVWEFIKPIVCTLIPSSSQYFCVPK